MPIRVAGESDGAARERVRPVQEPRTTPPPQPTPAPESRVRTQAEEPRPVPTPQATPTPADAAAPKEPVARQTPQQRLEQKREQKRDPKVFNFEFWEPKQPFGPPDPNYDPVQAAGNEFVKFTEWWDSLNDNLSGLPPDPVADASEFMSAGSLMPMTGRQEDVLDSYLTLFRTYKNLEEHIKQYEEFDPEGMAELDKEVTPGVRNSATAIASAGTLTPWRAMLRALDNISQEHPDNYTQYLATDVGFADLFSNSLMAMYSPPQRELSILTPGEGAGQLIDQYMADVPFLKPALINTVELLGDPIFIGATVLFPPAGLAAKAALGAKVAVGMAIGEEVAEEVGLPGIVGALPGGLLGPGLTGFTRSALRNAVRKARAIPIPGEPATEMLIRAGEIPSGRGKVMFHGTTPEGARGIAAQGFRNTDDVFLTTEPDLAGQFAARGGDVSKRTVMAVEVPEGVELGGAEAIRTIKAADAGKVRVIGELSGEEASLTGEQFLARMNPYTRVPSALGFKPIAGGAPGPSPESFRLKIRAHLERPESRDFLRLVAGKVADWVPLGLGKRLQEVINRMAVADEPALKAAFGWHFQLAEDQAARFMSMAPLRGAKVPFLENAVGQIWMPRVAGAGKRTVGNLFRRGEGEWIAVGDVFESVMRGEKRYLSRLTDEQVAWVKTAEEIMAPYIRFAEQASKITLRKRETWWPRFAVDPTRKTYNVSAGTRRGKPPALFTRQFEEQQQAIAEFGIKYRPGVLNQLEGGIDGFQKITRDSLMARYLKDEGVLKFGRPRLEETYATDLGTTVQGIVSKVHANEIMNIIGPGTRNPVVAVPQKINGIARLILTGTLDTGWGAIQLITLAASPAGPKAWGEAMARGFYNALVEPKQFYRYMANSPGAQRYATYGGDLGMSSELMEAARQGGLGLPRAPIVSPLLDVATFPLRSFVNRMQVGFDASLAYGRVLAFDAMAEVATKPGMFEKVAGAGKALTGEALHEELFRLARFTDTLIGQPKLGGVITAQQHQVESAFVWFATRYTRSFLGTASYMLGRGYTPAQARATMAKMLLGGMSVMSGLIAARGVATGMSQKDILDEISVALNPTSGKKFMSMKMGKGWYGLGGTYRSGIAVIAGIANKDNWDFENWEEGLYENPIVRGWRSRASPFTGQLMNFGPNLAGLLTGNSDVSGSDFLGYSVNISEMVDDPRKLGDYAIDNFAPITIDSLLQGNEKDWQSRMPRFIAEFFGLRTSPETAFEALEPVMNRISQDTFGTPYSGLENNLPARDYIQNHPDVLTVTEGQIRPIRERKQEKLWRKYREGRQSIRDTHVETRENVEDTYVRGRMNGSDYREKYGEAQSAEYFELRGFSEGIGITFDETDAPAGTVDAALDAYFSINLDDYRDPSTRIPDWEAFYSDRDAALAMVPPEHTELVGTWLRRRETEVRRQMRQRFESVIEPSGYFRMRESVAVNLEISLDDLESALVKQLQKGDQRAAPGDVARLVDKVLNGALKDVYGDSSPTISQLRQKMREDNPSIDAELFRQGFTTTVRSEAAQEILIRYRQMWPGMGYFEAPLAGNID